MATTWTDLAGLVGFFFTIYAAFAAKSASEAAQSAAERARDNIRLLDTVVDAQSVISALETVKRMHRGKEWNLLPERYSSIRRQLIMLREGSTLLDDDQQRVIQNAITNLSDMERMVEKFLAKNSTPQLSEKLNSLISEDSDALVGVLQAIKVRGGVN